jgi:YD repeat-containing protein
VKVLLSRWMFLSLLAACAGAPPSPDPVSAAPVPQAKSPAGPALPEPPDIAVAAPSVRADRLLPGPCRQRQVEGFGTQSSEVTVARFRYEGDRPHEVEVVDASGGFIWRAEPKLDAEGRVVESVERGSDRKPLATRTFTRDAQGNVVRETWQKAGEKKPSFERAVTLDAGRVVSETWRLGAATWKLTPALDASGQPATLTREDGKVVARWVRDARGNALMESRLDAEGHETRVISDYGCFGVDETAATRLAELCRDDGAACVALARLLGEDAYALGLAPDPARAAAYRIHACRKGDAASCLHLAEKESDPDRSEGFRHEAKSLFMAACQGGDGKACGPACELGDPASCSRRVASDDP